MKQISYKAVLAIIIATSAISIIAIKKVKPTPIESSLSTPTYISNNTAVRVTESENNTVIEPEKSNGTVVMVTESDDNPVIEYDARDTSLTGLGNTRILDDKMLLDAVNSYRVANGLHSLTENLTLCASAQNKSNDMTSNKYFAHDSPQGRDPWSFIDESGYRYISAGENIAMSNKGVDSIVDGWYNSPGHRENMLGDFTETCIRHSSSASFMYNNTNYTGVNLVTEHFGKPL